MFSIGRDEVMHSFQSGLFIAIFGNLAVMLVLEVFSLETVRGVWKQPNGKDLYAKAMALNFFNHLVLGIPLYVFATLFICTKKPVTSPLEGILQVLWVVVAHDIQYYVVHKWFHENSHRYRCFHRFHHRFNTFVPPSAANAVTPGEYCLAYIIPFAIAVLLLPTHISSLNIALWIVSVANILVHTPRLEALSIQWLPSLLVSTNNHLDHHRKLQMHYASPTFNVDAILEYLTKKI